ncbi:ABC transporter substrate-binding protein [Pleionea sediminis]|uniref:ABC transporter substrate-binding protein n=1 Tax=Pleionea sediminis TaxID=2569479 RepID=UPI0013DE284F|nr:ABC transporter substrate-binding protein [Pleionea sediminis]
MSLISYASPPNNKGNTQNEDIESKADKALFELSLAELMAVRLSGQPQGYGIFQSNVNQVSDRSINLGIVVPLKKFPYSSASVLAAADLAVNDINSNGGVAGKPLALIRADDEHLPSLAIKLTKQLIDEHQIFGIIGPMTSQSTLDVLSNVSIPSHTPLITFRASASHLNKVSKNQLFYRLTPDNNRQVDLIFEELNSKDLLEKVVFIGTKDVYGQEILSGIEEKLKQNNKALSHKLELNTLVDLNLYNMKDQIRLIERLKPTAIIIATRPDFSDIVLKKLETYWTSQIPLILMGDIINRKYAKEKGVGDIKQCVKYIVAKQSDEATSLLQSKIKRIFDVTVSGNDTGYAYDSVMLFAMAKMISTYRNISFESAMESITREGHIINYRDYRNIIELYDKYGKLSYHGTSGKVSFDESGENLAANLSWDLLSDQTTESSLCKL